MNCRESHSHFRGGSFHFIVLSCSHHHLHHKWLTDYFLYSPKRLFHLWNCLSFVWAVMVQLPELRHRLFQVDHNFVQIHMVVMSHQWQVSLLRSFKAPPLNTSDAVPLINQEVHFHYSRNWTRLQEHLRQHILPSCFTHAAPGSMFALGIISGPKGNPSISDFIDRSHSQVAPKVVAGSYLSILLQVRRDCWAIIRESDWS